MYATSHHRATTAEYCLHADSLVTQSGEIRVFLVADVNILVQSPTFSAKCLAPTVYIMMSYNDLQWITGCYIWGLLSPPCGWNAVAQRLAAEGKGTAVEVK